MEKALDKRARVRYLLIIKRKGTPMNTTKINAQLIPASERTDYKTCTGGAVFVKKSARKGATAEVILSTSDNAVAVVRRWEDGGSKPWSVQFFAEAAGAFMLGKELRIRSGMVCFRTKAEAVTWALRA